MSRASDTPPPSPPPHPPISPLYLLPPLPFLSRASPPANPARSKKSPAPPEPHHLPGHAQYLKCRSCLGDLCPTSSIISKGFTGRHGRAYLLSTLPAAGITLSPPTPRPLITGMHTVSDMACAVCGEGIGWKYVSAEKEDQRYKVGKYILERERVVKVSAWEQVAGPEMAGGRGEAVDVDVDDEGELENLFLGLWTAEGAERRRRARV
ncbi:yippee family protein [Morchella snyderi]|nr:yippee family protein [Morchella snyderi]